MTTTCGLELLSLRIWAVSSSSMSYRTTPEMAFLVSEGYMAQEFDTSDLRGLLQVCPVSRENRDTSDHYYSYGSKTVQPCKGYRLQWPR